MSSGPPPQISRTAYAPHEARQATAWPTRLEDPSVRQYVCAPDPLRDDYITDAPAVTRQRLQRSGIPDVWSHPPTTLSVPTPGISAFDPRSPSYSQFLPQQRPSREDWAQRRSPGIYQEYATSSPWPGPTSAESFASQSPMASPGFPPGSRGGGHSGYPSWPAPLLRRTSSDDTRLSQFSGPPYGADGSSSATSLQMKQFPQRRPSNRDEFDGPSQLLDKPDDGGHEPTEDELPQLPVTLYAQEQDEILSSVNDRLSQCAFDFVARYQFPIPLEPDKRPVRVPGDREWSEWVHLLKRLATKRRVPARVLYRAQIKQLITILENSLEMRHAAKHQSRPLKDDRNVLQLVSSGLQVALILKDAPAMRHLDSLYVRTERLIQGRRGSGGGGAAAPGFAGGLCIM